MSGANDDQDPQAVPSRETLSRRGFLLKLLLIPAVSVGATIVLPKPAAAQSLLNALVRGFRFPVPYYRRGGGGYRRYASRSHRYASHRQRRVASSRPKAHSRTSSRAAPKLLD